MAMSLVERARALWETRAILWLLIVRDLKVRYAGSVLGYMWTILDPLMMTGVYWFIFSVVFTGRRIGEDPYVLFIVMGLLSWQWFSASVTGCSTALGSEARLVRSTRLPARDLGAQGGRLQGRRVPLLAADRGAVHGALPPRAVLADRAGPDRDRAAGHPAHRHRPGPGPGHRADPRPGPGGADRAPGAVLPLAGHLLRAPPRDRAAAEAVPAQPHDRHPRHLPLDGVPGGVHRLEGGGASPPCSACSLCWPARTSSAGSSVPS